MQLVRLGEPFPFSQHVESVEHIPHVDPDAVARFESSRIDVTTHADGGFRRFIPGPIRLYTAGGALIMEGSPEVIKAALDGGGDFGWLADNGLTTCKTLEEFVIEAQREAEQEAEDRFYEYDY